MRPQHRLCLYSSLCHFMSLSFRLCGLHRSLVPTHPHTPLRASLFLSLHLSDSSSLSLTVNSPECALELLQRSVHRIDFSPPAFVFPLTLICFGSLPTFSPATIILCSGFHDTNSLGFNSHFRLHFQVSSCFEGNKYRQVQNHLRLKLNQEGMYCVSSLKLMYFKRSLKHEGQ